MALKIFGLTIDGQKTAVNFTGSSLQIFADRVVIGETVYLRNADVFGKPDGYPPRFLSLVAEVEEDNKPVAPTVAAVKPQPAAVKK